MIARSALTLLLLIPSSSSLCFRGSHVVRYQQRRHSPVAGVRRCTTSLCLSSTGAVGGADEKNDHESSKSTKIDPPLSPTLGLSGKERSPGEESESSILRPMPGEEEESAVAAVASTLGGPEGSKEGGGGGLGEYKPADRLPGRGDEVLVGDPQKKPAEKEMSVTSILKELTAIQEQGPQKYCVLGTRHCSYLHQRIIELLAYALVLSGNHVYTSGAGGTHAATIRGALRAERPDLLTVVLPQSLPKQPKESQELLKGVTDIIQMPQNDELSLDIASRICNSYMLSQTDHLVSFAFHESKTVIEASREARDLDMLVTTLFLD